MQRRCEMVSGRAILAATTNKKMNARTRTMAPAKQSTAATFCNIQRPYHRTGENRRIVTKNHKTPECSNGYRQKNLGNSLHLAPNGRQHLALRSCAHLATYGEAHLTRNSRAHIVAHGRAHIGSNSRAHIVATIRGHLGDANTGQTSGQLATFKGATSRLHLRAPRVGNNNPGARLFILKAANPPMIRGSDQKQFFIPRTISIAYSIRDAYGSTPNDKLRL
jgi:hypothetical protein